MDKKSLIPKCKICFSITQYPFRIIYLLTQIKMVIVYRTPVLNTVLVLILFYVQILKSALDLVWRIQLFAFEAKNSYPHNTNL